MIALCDMYQVKMPLSADVRLLWICSVSTKFVVLASFHSSVRFCLFVCFNKDQLIAGGFPQVTLSQHRGNV